MKLVVTAGGTGGHIMPALAVAEAVREINPDTRVLFIGTDRGMEQRLAEAAGFEFAALHAYGIKGKRPADIVRAGFVNVRAFGRALKLLHDFAPGQVVGTGGYVTGMVVLAATLKRIPTAIHEQNTVPGITNRILGHLVTRVYTAFPDTNGAFPARKTTRVGNPLRHALMTGSPADGEALLILGGSLGASSINTALPAALTILKARGITMPVIHQTGTRDEDAVRETYARAGVTATVKPFIDDMAAAYRQARLAVCRAGGLSLAELSRLGVPAVIIPFPHAADDHQTHNARFVAEAGGGWLIPDHELTPERLADKLASLLADQETLEAASKAMLAIGLGDGAASIAEEITRV